MANYKIERNSWIPVAEQRAEVAAGEYPTRREGEKQHKFINRCIDWAADWNRTFHAQMNKLCFEAGIGADWEAHK